MLNSKYDYTLEEIKYIGALEKIYKLFKNTLGEHKNKFLINMIKNKLRIELKESNGKLFFELLFSPASSSASNSNPPLSKFEMFKAQLSSHPKVKWEYLSVQGEKQLASVVAGVLFNVARIAGSSDSKLMSDHEIIQTFNNWLSLVYEYEKFEIPEFYKSVEDQYAEEFYHELKLIDEDADFKPFSLNEQLRIDSYLEKTIECVKVEQEGSSEDYSEIIDAADKLRKDQSKLSKNATLNKLSVLLGKIRAKSIPFFKMIFNEFTKTLMSEMLKKSLGE